jgi:hypothetical protein
MPQSADQVFENALQSVLAARLELQNAISLRDPAAVAAVAAALDRAVRDLRAVPRPVLGFTG